jgi:SHS family lactate transporter-like MFS transporter
VESDSLAQPHAAQHVPGELPGAICDGTFFGYWSQRWGRWRAMITAAALGIVTIPLWSGLIRFPGATALSLGISAFLLQFTVRGAWGIIPAHLNELSPGDVTGTSQGSLTSSAICWRRTS